MVEVIRRLSLLNEAARALTSILDPDALLDRILDLTREVFGFDACAVLLVDSDSGDLVIRRARGYDETVVASFRGKAGEGITGRALAQNQAVVENDISRAPDYVAGVRGAVAEVAVPLRLNSSVLGVLDAESKEPLELSQEDLALLQSFASQAATVVHNAQMHQALQAQRASLERRLELQRLLARASEAMLSSLNCDEVLDEILGLAKAALHFETCAVLLLEDDEEHLVLRAAHGYRDDWRELRIPVGQGVTGEAVRKGEVVVVNDVHADPRYIAGVSGARSELAVPLRVRDRIIGVLDVEARDVAAFDEEAVETFSIFASYAAVALRNAAQMERIAKHKASLERQLRRQAMVKRAGEAVRSTLNEEAVLQRILDIAREALELKSCAALLLSPGGVNLRIHAAVGYGRDVIGLVFPAGEGITGAALAEGRPVLVADVTKDGRYIAGMTGGRCEMAAPLIVEGEVVGVLDAEADAVDGFDEEDLSLFQIFASDVAVAIRNARQFASLARANATLEEHVAEIERMNQELSIYADQISRTNLDLEARVRELGTIYEASQTITSSLDLSETLKTIVEMTRVIINASSSAIRLLDEESDELRARGAPGSPDSGLGADSGSLEAAPIAKSSFTGPHIETPLRIGDRTIGFFELGREEVEFNDEEKRMLRTLASQAAIAIENSRLFERTQRTYYETIRGLAEALEARDAYTRGHSERVTRYALAIAEAMDLSPEDCRIIEHAGLLHDIGKIGISDTILHKTTKLSQEDRLVIEHHPIFGDTILGPIKFLHHVQQVVKHHHEHYDGGGYPAGLAGDAIPLSARIICVADSYDAMTSDRPYRLALARAEAVSELMRHRGTQFDPQVVDVFIELLDRRFPER